MQTDQLDNWMQAYIHAWETNDPGDIRRLFTQSARYFTAPFRDPWDGREHIVSGWLDRKDAPGSYEFRYEVLGLSGNKGFVRGWTVYHQPPRKYSNLWVVQLDEVGSCEEFIEWWMEYD